jgi:chromate transport protein ChrA
MAVQMGQPVLARAYREGAARLSIHILVLVSAALLMAVNLISPIVVLLLAGLVAMTILALPSLKPKKKLEKDSL